MKGMTNAMPLGDSPKIAGCMDLFRVQGRWGASARLAWIRCILRSVNDVCDGQDLSKQSPNSFPSPSYFSGKGMLSEDEHICLRLIKFSMKLQLIVLLPWLDWASFVECVWKQHINNVITIIPPAPSDSTKQFKYSINSEGEKLFVTSVCNILQLRYLSPGYEGQSWETCNRSYH